MRPVITALFLAACALAADPPKEPAKLTPEQEALKAEAKKWAGETTRLRKEQKWEEAIAAAEKMFAAEVKLYTENHDAPVGSLKQIAICRENMEQFDEAKKVRERVLTIQTERFSKDHWRVTDARLAVEHAELLGKLDADGRKAVRVAGEKYRSGEAEAKKQNHRQAADLFSAAADLRKKWLGEEHPQYAAALSELALSQSQLGEWSQAEPLLRQAIAITKRSVGDLHPEHAYALNCLALLYHDTGEYAKAIPLLVQTCDLAKRFTGEGQAYAGNLGNLAQAYADVGDYARAEPLYRTVLDLLKQAGMEEHPRYATTLGRLAIVYSSMGEHAKAVPLLVRDCELAKKSAGERPIDYASALGNLASVYYHMGKFAKAEPLYLQALELRAKHSGESHHSYATTLGNLALVYSHSGERTKAEERLLEARDLKKKLLGESHPGYATALNNLATLYAEAGENAKAEPLLVEARDICKKTLGERHPDYATAVVNLAYLYSTTGERAKAEPLFAEAAGIVAANLERTAEVQTEASQLTSAKANRHFWENMLKGTAADTSSAAYEPLFRLRGAVTARQSFLRAVRQAKPETKPLVEKLQDVTRQITRLVNDPPDPKSGVDVRKKLTALSAEYAKLQRELASQSDAFAEYAKRKQATVADLQKALPDDTVLIDYLAYKDQLCAFVVTKTAVTRFELGAIKPISEAVDAFRGTLHRTTPLFLREDDPAAVLRAKLWTPLAKAVGGAKVVLVCPDGPLCRLPFAALPGTDDNKYLIEEVGIAVLPVPQSLFDLLAPRPETKDAPGLLLMGDVDFDTAAGAKVPEPGGYAMRRAGEWKALPGTRAEVAAVADSFTKLVPDGKLTTLRGKDATAAAVRAGLGGRSGVVHLATHGYFSPKELTAKLKAADGDAPGRRPAVNPGLLSGIVCAGANKPTADSDGVLTALQVAETDLSRVELAVLSACETGLGETAGGEGVLGLQRAFLMAGARTTVTSLWCVNDAATQKLMTRFYDNRLKRKLGALEALREAQLWMLADARELPPRSGLVPVDELPPDGQKPRTPPELWAAFVLAGDWR